MMPTQLAGRLIRCVRIHRVRRVEQAGKAAWIKHRRRGMDGVIAAGSLFLAASRSGIRMFTSVTRWQAWEVGCFNLLHGEDGFHSGAIGRRGLWQHELPGKSLRDHALAGTLSDAMVFAAGDALRRAHEKTCPDLPGGWTHGDPHLGNLIYDPANDRARLIDFETQHDPRLPTAWRRADDLFIFLLELLARLERPAWVPLVGSLLLGYDCDDVRPLLIERCTPAGLLETSMLVARSPGAQQRLLRENLFVLQGALSM